MSYKAKSPYDLNSHGGLAELARRYKKSEKEKWQKVFGKRK